LWLVLAVASAWVVLGTQVLRHSWLKRRLQRGRTVRHSVFALGLRLLQRWTKWHRSEYFELGFIPHGAVL